MRPGDRCGDGGPVQVDARALERRFFRLHAGLVLGAGGGSVVGILARDTVISDQRRVALGFLAIRDHQRLRLLQRGRRFVPGGAITGGIDLVKGLPGLHHIAFGKQALLNDTADLRAHFGAERGGSAASQLADHRHRLGLQRNIPTSGVVVAAQLSAHYRIRSGEIMLSRWGL